MKPWVQLTSGARYEIGASVLPFADYDRDFIWPLARTPRFNAQTPDMTWSVLSHEVACYRLALALGYPAIPAWLALTHDHAEALLGDIVGPVLAFLRAYDPKVRAALEAVYKPAEKAAAAWAGGRVPSATARWWGETEVDLVKRVDLAVLQGERRAFLVDNGSSWYTDSVVEKADADLAEDIVRAMHIDHEHTGALAVQAYNVAEAEAWAGIDATGMEWPWKRPSR